MWKNQCIIKHTQKNEIKLTIGKKVQDLSTNTSLSADFETIPIAIRSLIICFISLVLVPFSTSKYLICNYNTHIIRKYS